MPFPLSKAFGALSFVLLVTACADSPTTAVPKAEPQLTFGTSGDEEVWGVSTYGDLVIVVGSTTGALDGVNRGSVDAFVRMYESEGDMLWASQLGTPLQEIAKAVVAHEGFVYVVGETGGSLAGSRGATDAFIRKYDIFGNVLWTRQFGTSEYDAANSVAVAGDGTVYVAGLTWGVLGTSNAGANDAFVRKYTPDGVVVWTKQFGSANSDQATGVAINALGNVYVVGTTFGNLKGTSRGQADAFIRSYNESGDISWTKQFGTSLGDRANAVAVGLGGDAIVVGTTEGTLEGSSMPNEYDTYCRRYSAGGLVVVTKQFRIRNAENGLSVASDSDGSFFITGSSYLPGGVLDVFVRKYSNANRHVWTRLFGTSYIDGARAVSVANTGAIYVGGNTYGALAGQNAGGQDAFLRRLDANGNTVWTDQ